MEDQAPVQLPEQVWADLVRLLAFHQAPVPARVFHDGETALWEGYRLQFDPVHIAAVPAAEEEEEDEEDDADALLTGWSGHQEQRKPKAKGTEAKTIEYPDVWVMFVRPGLPWAPFEHLLAAQRLADGLPDLPLMPFSHTVSPPVCYRPMVLRRLPAGVPGTALMGDKPVEVFEALGRVIRAMQDVWGPFSSTRADREQFLRATSWSEAVLERVGLLRATLTAEDVDLGLLHRALFDRLSKNARALTEDPSPSLVHGALGPDTVRFDPETLTVLEVDGFEHAVVGDPLAEWGAAMRFGGEAFEILHRAAGSPDLKSEPEAVLRLQIGFDLQVANALACEAVYWRDLPQRVRAVAVHDACQHLLRHLSVNVAAVLDGTAVEPETRDAGLGVPMLRLAWCLGGQPRVALRETEVLAGAVALMEIHERFGHEEALDVSATLLERLGGRRIGSNGALVDVSPSVAKARSQPLPEGLLAHLAATVVARMLDILGPACPAAALEGAATWLEATSSFKFARKSMLVRFRQATLCCWCAVGEGELRTAAENLVDLHDLLPPADPIEGDLAVAVIARALDDPEAPVAYLGLLRLEALALLPCPIDVALGQVLGPLDEGLANPLGAL